MSENVIYLTSEWLAKLKEELDYLKTVKRLEIAEKLKEAISFWDLSENSEYEDARNEQAQVEKRIIDLEEQLKNVVLIDESKKDENKVKIWAVVTIQEVWKDDKETYKIVGSTESDILSPEPKISNESPVWKALIWKKKWDLVKVKAKAWNFEYKILEIK
jgi:transcription elongation factor GreA